MLRSRRRAMTYIGASAWPLLARSEEGGEAGGTRSLRVVASFSILADIVRNVAADVAAVTALVGANADAHVFEPTPADARRVAEADLVFVNGLGFEGWLDRLVKASGTRARIVVASDGITTRRLGAHPDPHAWQDLSLGRHYVANVHDALALERPAKRDALMRRATQYGNQIEALDRATRAIFETIPKDRRRVITSHDAFGYFGAAYGIEFFAPQGTSTESEASAATVARLADDVRRLGVRAIFVENISDPRLVERLATEGGSTVGGKLYSDALSAPGSAADTYLKLFAHNAKTIAAGLRGERPGGALGPQFNTKGKFA